MLFYAIVLFLPGAVLDVSLLVNVKKKFRGNRTGAMEAMQKLENDNLGEMVVKKCKGQVKFCRYESSKTIIYHKN